MAGVNVVLNGMNLYGTDGDGTTWLVTEDLDGWDAPAQRLSNIPLTGMDGSAVGEALYGPRTVSIQGIAKATSAANYWKARNLLAEKLNLLYASAVMTVDETTYIKRLNIRRAGLKMRIGPASQFNFGISVVAFDPIKYNDTETNTAYGTVTNQGNYNTYPVITLTSGAAANVTLTNPAIAGSPVVTLTNMNSGDIIDMRNHTVTTSGGVAKYASVNVPLTNWWWLVPGSNALAITGATATIKYRDAWI